MTHIGYILESPGASFLLLGLYTFSVLARGRRLSRQVPAARSRWSTVSETVEER